LPSQSERVKCRLFPGDAIQRSAAEVWGAKLPPIATLDLTEESWLYSKDAKSWFVTGVPTEHWLNF